MKSCCMTTCVWNKNGHMCSNSEVTSYLDSEKYHCKNGDLYENSTGSLIKRYNYNNFKFKDLYDINDSNYIDKEDLTKESN